MLPLRNNRQIFIRLLPSVGALKLIPTKTTVNNNNYMVGIHNILYISGFLDLNRKHGKNRYFL